MRKHISTALFIIFTALVLAACNQEGLAAFSPANDRIAIITNEQHLYITNFDGGNAIKIDVDEILWSFDVTFDPFGTKILYVNNDREICIVNAGGGGETCPVTIPNNVSVGFLSYLPNGQFVLAYQLNSKWELRVYNVSGGAPVVSASNIDHLFPTADAIKVKRGSNGAEWHLTPYNKPSGQQSLRWVWIAGGNVSTIFASGSLQGPDPVGTVNNAVQNALTDRDAADITSSAVSPDGTKLVFRTKTGTDPNFIYGLYVVDLATPNFQPVQLVSNANFRIQFSFSPAGNEVIYESNQGGRSVWIVNANGTNSRKLSDDASLPKWHQDG